MKRYGIPLLLLVFGTTGACSQSTDPASPSAAAASMSDSLSAKGTTGGGHLVDTPVTSDLGPNNGSVQISSDSAANVLYQDGVSGVGSIIQTSNTCCNDWLLHG